MNQSLWNTKEVALYLNVKESTIRNWVHIGYIPHVKFRGLVRYQRDSIDAWLAKCTVGMRHAPGKTARVMLGRRHESPRPDPPSGKG